MRNRIACLVLGAVTCLVMSLSCQAMAGPIGQRQKASPVLAEKMLAKCPKIAFIRRANYGMRGTNAVMFAQRTGVGSAICVYDPARPKVAAKTIFETKAGFIFDMNPSYDGKKLVFSYKTAVDQPFHIWEIQTDGSGLKQLTRGHYHDVSPVYYPDGRIIFTSSRVESYSLCQNFLAFGLHIIDADGSNLRRFDFTTLCSLSPTVMSDGKVLCTRWEYQDKNIFAWEGLWTIYPNGRQLQLYHGNTFRIPNAVYGGRQIPDTDRVMVVWAAHHQPPVGDLAIVDRSLGLESPESMWKVTHVTPIEKDLASGKDWRKTGIGSGAADRYYSRAFADPFPFTKDLTLVAFGGDDPRLHHLYVLNHNTGDTALLYKTDASCFNPVPLNRRPQPSAIPGHCPQEKGEGTFYVQDVYQGLSEQGVKRGMVKELRIMSQSPKKYNTEGPRYSDHYPLVGQGSYYVKENHGTVPVDENGSAYFSAPSNTELYFIALDASGKEIQRMGSVTQITTGEQVSCVGCHENRLKAPVVHPSSLKRRYRAPDKIKPPSWGAGPVNFVTQVQPVLDRYCIECHTGAKAKKGIDLTGDKTRFYNMAYESLVLGKHVEYYYINQGPNGVFPAMATGSWVSKLTSLIESKHGDVGVDVDDAGRRTLYAWIDANVPYYGTWEMTRPHTVGGRDGFARTKQGMENTWADQGSARALTSFEPWVKKFNDFASENGKQIRPIGFGGGNLFWQRGLVNLSRPENSPVLLDNLAKSAGGRAEDQGALFSSTSDVKYRQLLALLQEAKKALDANPRMDMPGAKPLVQERNFGVTFGARPKK